MTKQECENLVWSIAVAVCVVPLVYSLSLCVDKYFTFVLVCRDLLREMGSWSVLIPFIAGGIIVSIIKSYAPESEGPGLHIVIAAFAKRNGRLRLRTGPFKYVATMITLGSGSPSGIVSPSALLGNAVASSLGQIMKIDPNQQKTLSLCGISAALSALLGTPFGAALFAVEVVYGNYILYKRFFYCLVSSVTAYVFAYVLGMRTTYFEFSSSEFVFMPHVLFFIVVTALLSVFVNIVYISFYQRVHDTFSMWSWKNLDWLKLVVGMALAALIVAPFYPFLLNYGLVGGERADITALATAEIYQVVIAVVVIISATSLISGTGGSGGLFTPVMIVGSLLGIIVGHYTSFCPHTFMAAGMSAALCTTLNVPLASAILCVELFGPSAGLPAAVGSLAGYLLARRYVIYHEIQWEELKE